MDPKHVKNVSSLPCLVCGRQEPHVTVDPHHLQRGLPPGERGTSRTAPDKRCVPLCREHHDAAERDGDDEGYLAALGINGRDISDGLWHFRANVARMFRVVERSLNARRIYLG